MFLLKSRQIEFQNLDAVFISSGEQNTSLNIIYCLVFLKTEFCVHWTEWCEMLTNDRAFGWLVR